MGFLIYEGCKTNVDATSEYFIVSNYELFRGEYKFIYNARPSGRERLVFNKKNCVVLVDSVDNDPNKTKVNLRLENFGRFNPLSECVIIPKEFYNSLHPLKSRSEFGEELLNRVSAEYADKIPFEKILDKIKD